MKLNGLTTINIELTDTCNHKCWCCGRRDREKQHPEIKETYGYMDFELVKKIASEVPEGIVIQFHNNGDPLLYPSLGYALSLFPNNIKCFNTKASQLLLDKRYGIIDVLDTLTISHIPNDPDWKNQYILLNEFLEYKKDKKPNIILRLTGEIESGRVLLYEDLADEHKLIVAKRLLHSPRGSFQYRLGRPTIPEIGICLDFLNHLAINKDGDVSMCVRYDPERLGVLGNIKENTLEEIWTGQKRMDLLELHKRGKRDQIDLCSQCDYWGVPTGRHI